MKKKIVIGSRGSILAMAQSEMIKKMLENNFPELEFEIKKIVTSGDTDLVSNWNNSDKSLKSFFTKEIEVELLNGTIDLAVHSMKDMPVVSPEGLICGAVPDREDSRDVLVSKSGKTLMELPAGAIVGTSSLRRTMNLKNLRSDLEIKQLRGNIHTRLNKLKNEDYDAILLAAAGLKRVGLEKEITEYLDPEKFDGGCHTPMGCHCILDGDKITLTGIYFKGENGYSASITEDAALGIKTAQKLADIIKEKIND